MPKRVRHYGSAEAAEAAALARTRPIAGDDEPMSELATGMTAREIVARAAEAACALNDLTSDGAALTDLDDVREIIAGLGELGQDLPQLCEQLARILVTRREDGLVIDSDGADPDFWVTETVEALAAAGQAADMMSAALGEAARASAGLRAAR
jgi:glutamate dehydrogenase/leucine dehydrogenase